MIQFRKYGGKFKLVKNKFKFARCDESDVLIWPWQQVYIGGTSLTWPVTQFVLTQDAYLVLKLKGEV